jgi:NAD-dependent deacetylase
MDRIEAAGRELRDADAAAALTGAGVSVPSGVPPFRGEGGIWDEYDPETFDVQRFRRDPGGFWVDWLDLRADLLDADLEPNSAHDALADLTTAGHLDAVVTQNIDGLHQRAGTDETVELHGNARRAVCQRCGRTTPAEEVRNCAESGDLPPRCGAEIASEADTTDGAETRDEAGMDGDTATCDGVLKPDAVLFGERLPEDALACAQQTAADSDVLLVAGSSLTVEPAASLPRRAADRGATLILVNLDETPLDARADYVFREDVTETLPALRDAAVE